ncbi:MAG TPA: 5-bromo-4-chloroindolyl phosphate hydrolysis protein [Epulopiscium sp.]|nr:5-bromo-4-chloroindolyl phosphate hydrolysis protein [Candidatus Epulonipiscium sp.]
MNNQGKNTLNNQVFNTLSRKPTKYTVPTGQVSGVLLTVFGTMGSVTFGIAVFVLTLLGIFLGKLFYIIAIGLLPLFTISLMLNIKGSHIRSRLKRFQQYILCLGDRSYCLINDMSSRTGFSNKYIEKDLRKMIASGMFPQGHIDHQKTTFILTNECYKQYLEMQSLEAKKRIENKHFEKKPNKNHGLSPEMRKSLDEGRKFVSNIRTANFAIPGEEISLKLDRLEEITGKIFDYVEIHPEKFTEIKRFTEYFLPTTLKLVDAYRKLDDQAIQGVNITSAKQEIEGTMDTINLAFENLLDDLFQDIAMDISTDISVLETMLAQEGLTDSNMRVKNEIKEDKE